MSHHLEGAFKCFVHDFATNEPEGWQAHIGEKEHTYTGTSSCVTCGESVEVNWSGKLKNRVTPNVLCKGCKAQ